jgi:hypothetical protein
VSAAVTRSQDNHISVSRGSCIAFPTLRLRWYIKIPFGLKFEVSGLRGRVVYFNRGKELCRSVVAVIVYGYVAIVSEENDKNSDSGNG